jgi:hypothetical protein
MKVASYFLLFGIILLYIPLAFAASIDKITCDDLYPTFNGECKIEGECYKGLLIVIGKKTVTPTVALISDVFKSVKFTPNQEGEVKVIAVCFKPKIEVKKIKTSVKKASFISSKDFSSSLAYLKTGMKTALVSGLPQDKCFWVHPFFNGTHYLLVIDVFKDDVNKCFGNPIETREIVLEKPTNIYYTGNSCICGKDILLERLEDGINVRCKE